MFGLDPLSRPVAIAEILLLLAFAAFVGWLLGRLVLSGRISALRSALASKESELKACRQSEKPVISARNTLKTSGNGTMVAETPAPYVSADPLLPAYSHDDTPELTDEIPSPTVPEEVSVQTAALNASDLDVHGRIDGPLTRPVPVPIPVTDTVSGSNSEADVLNRIAARIHEVNFDRIGRATAAEADDLKDIIGVGPFLERKLHSLGIYTFRQVANFTKEDVTTINSIIEFFPGRIERDNWVEQSQAFYERKYGAKS